MSIDNDQMQRVFKTAWFSKAARKAHIPDAELQKTKGHPLCLHKITCAK
jgi:hypothetical protein